jgi:hypothetical protein
MYLATGLPFCENFHTCGFIFSRTIFSNSYVFFNRSAAVPTIRFEGPMLRMGLGCGTCDFFTLSSEKLDLNTEKYFHFLLVQGLLKKRMICQNVHKSFKTYLK